MTTPVRYTSVSPRRELYSHDVCVLSFVSLLSSLVSVSIIFDAFLILVGSSFVTRHAYHNHTVKSAPHYQRYVYSEY